MYRDCAPIPEELATLIDMADVRLKVIISLLSLGGFRNGTLTKLRYRHVKRDLEKGVTPIHIHVEADITKGKYHDYDTFVSQEAADYLRLYLQARRKGTEKIPPETVADNSPLIRNIECRTPVTTTMQSVHKIVHDLYVKAGMLPPKPVGRCYSYACTAYTNSSAYNLQRSAFKQTTSST